MLFTSLLVQAQTALVNSGTKKHGTGRSRNKTFRQSFLSAFASRIGERLAEATAGAVSQESAGRGTDLVPVLAAREQEVEQAVERMFPNLVSHAIRTSWDREDWAAGRTAAAAAAGRGHALGEPRRPDRRAAPGRGARRARGRGVGDGLRAA